jgi:hypothetical protein
VQSTLPVPFDSFDLLRLIILGKLYKVCSLSFCNYPLLNVNAFLLGTNINLMHFSESSSIYLGNGLLGRCTVLLSGCMQRFRRNMQPLSTLKMKGAYTFKILVYNQMIELYNNLKGFYIDSFRCKNLKLYNVNLFSSFRVQTKLLHCSSLKR